MLGKNIDFKTLSELTQCTFEVETHEDLGLRLHVFCIAAKSLSVDKFLSVDKTKTYLGSVWVIDFDFEAILQRINGLKLVVERRKNTSILRSEAAKLRDRTKDKRYVKGRRFKGFKA